MGTVYGRLVKDETERWLKRMRCWRLNDTVFKSRMLCLCVVGGHSEGMTDKVNRRCFMLGGFVREEIGRHHWIFIRGMKEKGTYAIDC